LFRVELQATPFDPGYVESIRRKTIKAYRLGAEDESYYFTCGRIENKAYNPLHERILIKFKQDELIDISQVSEQLNNSVIPTTVGRFLLCYPKEVS
jgi:uncharacterized protein